MRCIFEVAGKPFGKARHRTGRYGAYNPASNVEHEKRIREAYLEARGILDPTDAPVGVCIEAFFEIPKTAIRKRKPSLIEPGDVYMGKPGGDNILKSVKDALNKVAYLDDKQVVQEVCTRRYGNEAKMIIVVWTMDRRGKYEEDQ